MRKGLCSPLLAAIAGLMVAATPVLAQVVVSSPVAGNGTDGNEQCASGTYATNRSESTIAVAPTNPSHMLGLSKLFFSSPSSSGTDWSSVYRFHLGSYDFSGGSVQNQLLPGYTCTPGSGSTQWDATTDPNLAFDAQGNAYSAVLARNYNNRQNEIAVNKRPAGQSQWGPPVVVDQFTSSSGLGRFYDKEWIAADWTGKTNNVYVAFAIVSPSSEQVYFARSTDGGQTFSQPRVVSSLGGINTYVYLDVDPSGNLYLEYTNFSQLFFNVGRAVVQESTDGGRTFSPSRVGPSLTSEPLVSRTNHAWTLPNTTFRDGIIDYFAVSHTHPGHLYIAAEQWDKAGCAPTMDPNGDYDVAFYSSLDGGQTWSAAQCANDAATRGDDTDQFQPSVAADAQGAQDDVAVAWYDRRADCPTSQPGAGYYTRLGAHNYCIQTGLQWYSDSGSAVSPSGPNQLFGPIWDPQEPANEAALTSTTSAWPSGYDHHYVSDLPHSVLDPCYNTSFGTFIPVCVTFIGDYFGLAVSGGTADILNVSTYPTFNTVQPVSQWAQPSTTSGAFTAAATYPAANNYYQQQVLITAKAP